MIQADTAQTTDSHRLPRADRHADRPGQPDARRGRESLNLFSLGAFQDRSGADETDAGRHALDHPAQIRDVHAGFGRKQDEERGAESDEHMRAQSGSLTRAFPLPPEQRPEERRDRDSCDDPDHLRAVRQMKEIFDLHTCGPRYQRSPGC